LVSQERSTAVPLLKDDSHPCTPLLCVSRAAQVKRTADVSNADDLQDVSIVVGCSVSECRERLCTSLIGRPDNHYLSAQNCHHDHYKALPRGQTEKTGLTLEFSNVSVNQESAFLTPEIKRCRYDSECIASPCLVIPRLDLDEDDCAGGTQYDTTPKALPTQYVSTPHTNTKRFDGIDYESEVAISVSTSEMINPRQPTSALVCISSSQNDMPQHQELNCLVQETAPKAKQKVVTLHLSLPNCTIESDDSMAATPIKQNAKKFMVNLSSSFLHFLPLTSMHYCRVL